MVESTKVNMFWIKKKEKDFSRGLMEDHTTVSGKMVNNKGKESIRIRTVI